MSEVVSTLGTCESIEALGDGVFELVNDSCGGTAEHRFELGEGQFDGIQVGTVGWQINEAGADPLDGLAHSSHFVSRQVVHDHCIPGPQRSDELLLDIRAEDLPVHRSVDHQRSGDSANSQRADERRRSPVAIRDFGHQALASKRAAIETRELGVGSRFVNKYQLLRMKMSLPEPPQRAALGNVRPILFRCVQNFF